MTTRELNLNNDEIMIRDLFLNQVAAVPAHSIARSIDGRYWIHRYNIAFLMNEHVWSLFEQLGYAGALNVVIKRVGYRYEADLRSINPVELITETADGVYMENVAEWVELVPAKLYPRRRKSWWRRLLGCD